jgi:hypothetical protein
MTKKILSIAAVASFTLTVLAVCNDKADDGPGNDSDQSEQDWGAAYPCGKKSDGSYDSGNVCTYNVWGDYKVCAGQGDPANPTGKTCSTGPKVFSINQYSGTCNGSGACTMGSNPIPNGSVTNQVGTLSTCAG